jgi:hypothetical protein
MSVFKMGNKSLVTQSGDDEPVVASNVDFSSATFPAGHIRQVVSTRFDTSNSTDSNSTTYIKAHLSSAYHWTGQITDVLASSKVLITMSFGVYVARDSTIESGWGYSIVRDNTETPNSTSGTSIEDFGNCDFFHHNNTIENGHMAIGTKPSLTVLDSTPDTGTNNYYLAHKVSSSSASMSVNSYSTAPFICIMQEILV